MYAKIRCSFGILIPCLFLEPLFKRNELTFAPLATITLSIVSMVFFDRTKRPLGKKPSSCYTRWVPDTLKLLPTVVETAMASFDSLSRMFSVPIV